MSEKTQAPAAKRAAGGNKKANKDAASIKVVFGTMTIAGSVDQAQAAAQLDLFFARPAPAQQLDSKYEVDTAILYEDGRTEELLGRIFTEEQKSKMFLATKVNPWGPNGLKPESVIKQFETSLANLKMSSVDLLYLHAPDPKTPIETTLEACQRLYEQKKFKELGLSNYTAWQVADIVHICRKNGWVVPTAYQGMYNALTRDVERELLPCLRHFGIRFYAYNPLAGGLLTGRYASFEEKPAEGRFKERPHYVQRFWKKSYFDAVKLIKEACDAESIPMSEASIAWLRHHSRLAAGDAVIIGQSSMAHLESNLRGYDRAGPLPAAVVKAFDDGWKICRPDCPPYAR